MSNGYSEYLFFYNFKIGNYVKVFTGIGYLF